MKRCLRFFVLFFALSASAVLRADTDAEVSARKDALELAGAFGNDGFKIRDGHSCGLLRRHDHAAARTECRALPAIVFSFAENKVSNR